MADTVRYLLEGMVPELDDLEKRGYFSRAELGRVVQKRQEHEYALKRSAARLADYRRAIAFETSLEELRVARRRARGLSGKKTLADHCLVRRVHFIYQRATRRFRGDLALWGDWLRFCHATRSGRRASRVLARALALHPRCAALWTHAAAWELESNADAAAARALMQQGLRACKTDARAAAALWHEYFRLELLVAARLRARRALLGIDGPAGAGGPAEEQGKTGDATTDRAGHPDEAAAGPATKDSEAEAALAEIMRGGIARVVMRSALAQAPRDAAFRSRFLDILQEMGEFEGRAEIEEEIYAGLAADLPESPQAWALRARHAAPSGDARDAIAAGLEVFERGLAAAPSPGLYSEAVEFLVQALEGDAPGADETLATACELCRRAGEAGHGSVQVLLTWSQLRLRVGDLAGAAEVARTAAGMLPQAPELWETSLRLAVAVAAAASASRDAEQASGCPTTSHGDSSGDDEEADAPGPSGRDDALIGAALEAVRACPRSEGLWLLAVQCLVAAGHNPGMLRTQLEVVLAQGPRGPTEGGMGAVAAALFRAVALVRSPAAARKLYASLRHLPSPGGEFWHAVLDMELEAARAGRGDELPRPRILALFEAAVDAHGQEDADMWVRYMRYSAQPGSKGGTGSVYWKAVRALQRPAGFVERCQLERLA
ncbi:hypothetical protein ACKKBG_A12465 [Auxenochlorella protothecoides x Auxenochlorella symbiontica]